MAEVKYTMTEQECYDQVVQALQLAGTTVIPGVPTGGYHLMGWFAFFPSVPELVDTAGWIPQMIANLRPRHGGHTVVMSTPIFRIAALGDGHPRDDKYGLLFEMFIEDLTPGADEQWKQKMANAAYYPGFDTVEGE